MATLQMAMKGKNKFNPKPDQPAMNLLRRTAEERNDGVLRRLLADVTTFQNEINRVAATQNYKPDYLVDLVKRGLARLERNYRKRLADEKGKAEAMIATARDAWYELQDLQTNEARKATLALLSFEQTRTRYAGMSEKELGAAVQDYGQRPMKDPAELDLLSSELLKRKLSIEHTLLRRLMRDNNSSEPWLHDINAKKATEMIKFIDSVPEGKVKAKVGDGEAQTISFELRKLVGVDPNMSIREVEDEE